MILLFLFPIYYYLARVGIFEIKVFKANLDILNM